MELDDLKNIWKNGEAFQPKGEAEIATMLRGNSKSIVSKLKRSVWFELSITMIAGISFFLYALTLSSGSPKWTLISMSILFVVYCVYYIKKLILLNQFNPANENIRNNLENLHENLSGYLKFYKRSYAILYPAYFILVLIFGAIERGTEDFLNSFTQTRTIILLIATAGLFFFCSTWLTNWYLKKLYGTQMGKLQNLLHELQG